MVWCGIHMTKLRISVIVISLFQMVVSNFVLIYVDICVNDDNNNNNNNVQ